MDERVSGFIESLKRQLGDFPEQELNEAIGYYREYLSDADEAGKDLDEILGELGSPEKVAEMIRTEMNITRAERNPGLRNFTTVLRNAFHGVTTPMAIFLLSIFVVISFSLVIAIFAGAFVTFISAVIIAMGLIYEALRIPSPFTLEIVGTLGMAVFAASILMLTALGLYVLGRLLVKVSSRQMRWLRKKSGKIVPEMSKHEVKKKSNIKRTALVFTVLCVSGLVFLSASGLPAKYFNIFNSMKPENTSMKTMEFEPGKINKISLITAHSCIKLMRSKSDKILVSYEQPDWLDYEASVSGGMLSFYEKSNGRLPLFRLTALHESRTDLVVSIPEKYSPETISIETTGGFVYITGLDENIKVKTYTGNIYIDNKGTADDYNVIGNTGSGLIQANGKILGQVTNKGTEYYRNIKAKKTVELSSSRGNINID